MGAAGGIYQIVVVGVFLVATPTIILSVLFLFPTTLWLVARFAGVPVSMASLIWMRMRKIPPKEIIHPMIEATQAGIRVEREMLEAHYLAGGNVSSVVYALILADKGGVELSFEQAIARDLAGKDILRWVEGRLDGAGAGAQGDDAAEQSAELGARSAADSPAD